MKSIFKTAIALCIMLTTVATAEANPTKREIKAFVTENLTATAEYCEYHLPISASLTMYDISSVYDCLNDKDQKFYLKVAQRWCKKHTYEWELINTYGDAAFTIYNETGINDYAPEIITYTFLDAIYESTMLEDSSSCARVILDHTIYEMQYPNSGILGEYRTAWAEANPYRSEVVVKALEENLEAALEYFMTMFNEDYASMNEEELTACYLQHYKMAALEISRQETMMAQRHIIIANTIAKEYTINDSVVQEEFDKWYNEDYEMASLVISVE